MKKIQIILAGLLGVVLLLGMPSPALAFDVAIHEAMTREVFADFQVETGGESFKFTDYAIDQIVKANKESDDASKQFNSEIHFDNEDFPGGSKRVKDLKERVITKVTVEPTYGTSARNDMGTALHTVQDFYAHSNWVEIVHSSPNINSKIGREVFSGADKDTPTCPNDPATLDGEGLRQLTSGYFIFGDLTNPFCKFPPGKCLHGVPPTLIFKGCEGINIDNESRTGFTTARSLAVDATVDYLNQIFSDSRMKDNVDAIKLLMRIRS